jgi:hypothetical protein
MNQIYIPIRKQKKKDTMNLTIFKNSRTLSFVSLLALFVLLITGCVKQNFDEPPINIPHYNGKANATIDTLGKIYGSHPDTLLITQDIVIKGIVTANDESGNIYKKFFIQDSTAGIDVEIDASNLYTAFKVGQRVFIECKGLYLGLYGGALELGYPFNGSIGRMPAAIASAHIFRDSLPGKKPVPIVLDPVIGGPFGKYIGMLVGINAVSFPEAGQAYAPGLVTTSRTVADADGTALTLDGFPVILYNSGYSTFANNLLPYGIGTLQGILTIFNSKYEFLIRDLNDVKNFVDTGQSIIYQNNFDASPADWVIFNTTGNKPWTWSTYFYMSANAFGGSGACETWLISPAIDLTNVTNPILTFKTWTKFTDNGFPTPLEVKISTDYAGSGDPALATWSSLQCTLSPQNSQNWTSSGDVSLAAFNQPVYIAYRYRSSGNGSGTSASWEMDTFKVTGKKN